MVAERRVAFVGSIFIRGGRTLTGTVEAAGAKNSALKLLAAALLAPGRSRIANVPDISDVATMIEVVRGLGAVVDSDADSVSVDATRLSSAEAPYEVVSRMRASIAVLGPLVARLGRARVAMPGGCNIGSRKVDMHISGLESLGVEFAFEHGYIEATAPPGGLVGAHIMLEFPSVGATENLLMASVLASGTTVIDNAAREPEIVDLAEFLAAMGARVTGAGTSTIEVEGVEALAPAEHRVVGDRVECGTYLVAGALTGGPVTVRGVSPSHLEMVLLKLEQAGCEVRATDDAITVSRNGPLRATDVQTLPYPGFPTDMQPQFMVLMTLADGDSVITENVFENRFMFADELVRMGADIRIEGHHALVKGTPGLSGAPVRSTDLRAGAALVLAGLVADGRTEVGEVHHILRGYEGFVEKLASLGADIESTAAPEC